MPFVNRCCRHYIGTFVFGWHGRWKHGRAALPHAAPVGGRPHHGRAQGVEPKGGSAWQNSRKREPGMYSMRSFSSRLALPTEWSASASWMASGRGVERCRAQTKTTSQARIDCSWLMIQKRAFLARAGFVIICCRQNHAGGGGCFSEITDPSL